MKLKWHGDRCTKSTECEACPAKLMQYCYFALHKFIYFNEETILCVSTKAQFHLDKRPQNLYNKGNAKHIIYVCIVRPCVFTGVLVCACPWMYNITLQREHRKGGVSIQNYVMAASCLAFPRAPGDWKASRTPGCDFIKVWNERSVTRRSHTWHPAAGPFFPASSHSLGLWWLLYESLFH